MKLLKNEKTEKKVPDLHKFQNDSFRALPSAMNTS
jgi:hypothetical protein